MMTNFVMNDKCAAGTGRFLDVMARVLEVKVEELGDLAAKSTKDVAISSTCTVFAESEVISQLAMDTDKCDIINGIHHSVAARVAGLAHRVGVRELVVMTGGVAQNSGVVKALEEELADHLEALAADLERSGLTPDAVRERRAGGMGDPKAERGIQAGVAEAEPIPAQSAPDDGGRVGLDGGRISSWPSVCWRWRAFSMTAGHIPFRAIRNDWRCMEEPCSWSPVPLGR